MRPGTHFWLFLFSAVRCLAAHPCLPCHAKEVAAYSQSAMATSLRRPWKEPAGTFTTGSGTRLTILPDAAGLRQKLDRGVESSEYPVAYAIGSGRHAAGYLIRVGDHLFQSP